MPTPGSPRRDKYEFSIVAQRKTTIIISIGYSWNKIISESLDDDTMEPLYLDLNPGLTIFSFKEHKDYDPPTILAKLEWKESDPSPFFNLLDGEIIHNASIHYPNFPFSEREKARKHKIVGWSDWDDDIDNILILAEEKTCFPSLQQLCRRKISTKTFNVPYKNLPICNTYLVDVHYRPEDGFFTMTKY